MNSLPLMRPALALALASAAGTAAANVLVVRSAGPSARNYPPGMSLRDDASVRLSAGDSITVLGPSGTRIFRGPGAFRVAGPVQTNRWADAMARNDRRNRLGVVRGGGRPPSPWYVDVTRGGPVCLPERTSAALWRADAGAPATLAISAPGSAETRVEWPAGQATLAWPGSLPIAADSVYQLSGAGAPVQLRFKTVGSAPADRQELAALLIREGCESQLNALLATAPLAPE